MGRVRSRDTRSSDWAQGSAKHSSLVCQQFGDAHAVRAKDITTSSARTCSRSTNIAPFRHNPSMSQLSENVVLDALRQIKDPDLHKDIVTLGFIKDLKIDGGDVSFRI